MNCVVLHTKAENCDTEPGECWCDSSRLLYSEVEPEVVEFADLEAVWRWMSDTSQCEWIIDLHPDRDTIETVESLLKRKLREGEVVIKAMEYNWYIE